MAQAERKKEVAYEKEPYLNGTLASSMIVAAVIIVFWVGCYFIFVDRL